MEKETNKNKKDASKEKSKENVAQDKLLEVFNKALQGGAFPGAVIGINKGDSDFYFCKAFGHRLSQESENTSQNSDMREDTIFDLGEITILFCTASLLMRLIKDEKCAVNDLVSRYIQGFSVNGKSLISIKNLLTSQSGLIATYPFYEEIYKNSLGSRIGMLASRGAKEYVLNSIVRSNLKTSPDGKAYYSEIAMIILGLLIEVLNGSSLDKIFFKEIARSMDLVGTGFVDLSLLRSKKISPVMEAIAPTENCDWRGKILCGEVQNDNAWAMGGIAGNAGLFSCAGDVLKFSQEILKALKGKSFIFDEKITKEFLGVEEGTPTYLWERANKENGMINCGFSKWAVGINSFTGCSLWIDPEKDLSIVLLSNRIHPSRLNKKITSYRPQIITEALRLAES